MCGIAGFVTLQPSENDAKKLTSQLKAISHRGPDSEGLWTDSSKRVNLGHRRLATTYPLAPAIIRWVSGSMTGLGEYVEILDIQSCQGRSYPQSLLRVRT